MKVHHILFLAWAVVFAYWLFRQFQSSNKNYDDKHSDK